ncbi:MAG: ComF family protein [Dehalococcoidia bacterium]|nr:ComF family protein [Dehalococcoidia bacterium]
MKPAELKEAFLDLIFPPRCIGCGKEGGFLCAPCSEALPALEPPFCQRCGVPTSDGKLCQNCRNWSPAIDGIRSPFLHTGLARQAVHHLKYKNQKVLARPIAGVMAKYLKSNPLPVDVLTAVPTHPKRTRQRGYNQADLIVRELSQTIQLPASQETLARRRNTPSQVSLGAEARRKNVQEAFICKDKSLSSKRVLLVDDVCTTGATLNACAVALKEAGAASVWGLTFSREC